MGIWMEYDLITGVPLAQIYCEYNSDSQNSKLFGWTGKVRVLNKNSEFSDTGTYDYYGRVITHDSTEYDLTDENKYIAITEYTYNMIINHPSFSKYKDNLYELINNKSKTFNIMNMKLHIKHNVEGQLGSIPKKNDEWIFTNPDLSEKNHQRIIDRVNLLF